MTPEEKAEEMYYEIFGSFIGDNELCKLACTRCVEEIIEALLVADMKDKGFWLSVKEEITKL